MSKVLQSHKVNALFFRSTLVAQASTIYVTPTSKI